MSTFSPPIAAPRRKPDVTVVGGGPVGCVAAIAHAEQGANVLLLEARSEAPTRFAGEWIHPPGADVLRGLEIELPKSTAQRSGGRGFVVFPDDGSFPIVLDYPGAAEGFSAEHGEIVTSLWEASRAHPRIEFVSAARVARVESDSLEFAIKNSGGTRTVHSERIIGADGRSSITRKNLGYPEERHLLSYMAGLLLEDAELPFEGYGHVFLGGTGPALAYRISERHIRLCLDVPTYHIKITQKAAYLWDAFGPVLPPPLRKAFHRALERGPLQWAANQVTPRRYFGRDALALVGDAVGHYHPLTAVGMTLGFLDAQVLAQSPTVSHYSRERRLQGRVPELLANALYEVLTFYDDETVAVRQAVYRLWRENPEECRRTMRLLSSGDTELKNFSLSFCRVLGLATEEIVRDAAETGQWLHQGEVLGRLAGRLGWLAANAFPTATGILSRVARRKELKVDGALQQSAWYHRLRKQPTSDRPIPEGDAESVDAEAALEAGARALLSQQKTDGSWEGEVVWCPMLGAQYAAARWLIGRPLDKDARDDVLQHFRQTRLADGSWGLHEASPSTLFVTTLVYVACRLLGLSADDSLLAPARAFIRREGGVVAIPTWGKFWLALCNLYPWRGVNPLLPETWTLPEWLPIHPRNYYCHTRLIYTAMAYLFGKKFQAPQTPLTAQLRAELYPGGYERVDFASAAGELRDAEVISPPSRVLRMAYKAARLFESIHSPERRAELLFSLLEHIRYDMRQTAYRNISPVSGLLNTLAIWVNDPADPELDKALAGLDTWIWRDAHSGLRLAGAKSDVWDTAFAVQALETLPQTRLPLGDSLNAAKCFLAAQQVRGAQPDGERYFRQNQRGGFCFGSLPYGWSVSDCTAEALAALIEGRPEAMSQAHMVEAARFILRCQNRDGGFGSYEPRRSRWDLEWFNPAEMFGNSMTERSYVECTASAIHGLNAFSQTFPVLLDGVINPALKKAVSWLKHQQRPDGSWVGSWGINCIYGTMFGVQGLLSAGYGSTFSGVRKACAWLVSNQSADGSWGEHHSGCLDGRYVPHPQGQAIHTAWALMTLLRAHSPEWDVISAGARFLIGLQQADGSWPRQAPAGIFFNSAALEYELYRAYFPVWALALYERRRRERATLIANGTDGLTH